MPSTNCECCEPYTARGHTSGRRKRARYSSQIPGRKTAGEKATRTRRSTELGCFTWREQKGRDIAKPIYCREPNLMWLLDPPAPACQGHQGCVFRYSSLLTISGHAIQLLGYAFVSSEGSNRDQITLASSTYQDPFASLKINIFSSLF